MILIGWYHHPPLTLIEYVYICNTPNKKRRGIRSNYTKMARGEKKLLWQQDAKGTSSDVAVLVVVVVVITIEYSLQTVGIPFSSLFQKKKTILHSSAPESLKQKIAERN